MKREISLRRCWIGAFAFLLLCLPCLAQQGNLRTVLIINVKLDQEDNWKSAVKDFVALKSKAGSEEPFTMWESQTGPHRWAAVWYSKSFKELGEEDPKLKDSAADLTSVFSRLNGMTDSLEYWIDEMQPEFAIQSKEIPPYVRSGRSRVQPGKMDEMRALFRDQIFPAVKKSGATAYGVAVARFGTPTNEFHSYLGVNGWSDFDSPLGTEKGMSPAEWKAFQAKVNTVIESTEWELWKYHAELSYLPAQK